MKTVAIIQARAGSTRLPGKILADIGGATMLERVASRVSRISGLSEILIATSTQPADDAVQAEARRLGIPSFRGSEDDVLDRFWQAARSRKADCVVRITADCPLLDPEVSAEVVQSFVSQSPDYASNTLERTYPRGLDTEVVSVTALERAWREAREPYQRAHVTPYFYQHPELFRLLSVKGAKDFSDGRWTVDTADDLAFVRAVYERCGHRGDFSWLDVLALLEREPALKNINGHVGQKPLTQG
jgi:spore coat polysaccharide biosynthesis protein SpsF